MIDILIPNYEGYSAPSVVTLSNGAKCIAVGGDEGVVRLFEVEDDLTSKFSERENYMNKDFNGGEYLQDWGTRTYPAIADLNGDGIEDILLGNSRGGLNYIEGLLMKNVGIDRVVRKPFTIAPNPSTGDFTIFTKSSSIVSYRVIDLSGKLILSCSTLPGTAVSTSGVLSSGVYFVDVADASTSYATQKLVISN